jgi:purine-binding chemotaxis protein CheW
MSEFPADASVQIVVFEAGPCRYGLLARDVQEVLPAVIPVPLPRAPSVVEGVINVRGNILPVFNIGQRLHLPTRPIAHSDQLIVARAGDRLAALHVQRTIGIAQLDAADIEEVRGIVPSAEYVVWIAKTSDDLVLIHDLAAFLSRAESNTLDEAMSAAVVEGDENDGGK